MPRRFLNEGLRGLSGEKSILRYKSLPLGHYPPCHSLSGVVLSAGISAPANTPRKSARSAKSKKSGSNALSKYPFFASGEFLLSGDEIKSTGKMKEGTVPVPPCRPGLIAMITYCLFRWYRIMGGAEAAGVKPP